LKCDKVELWTKDFCSRMLNAQKDTIYRVLNHYGFNWRKFVTLLINRVLAIIDRSQFNDRVLIFEWVKSLNLGA